MSKIREVAEIMWEGVSQQIYTDSFRDIPFDQLPVQTQRDWERVAQVVLNVVERSEG